MSRAIRTFVCYGAQTEELHEGESLIAGRSTKCDLVLDDELASRQHLRMSLRDGQVFVEDLGSRNGLLINGVSVDGRQELHHGDQVTAGRSSITVLRQGREPRQRISSGAMALPEYDTDDVDQVTGAGNLVDLLDGSARRALEQNDLMVAERTALNLLGLLRRAALSRPVRPEELVGGTRLALDLAERMNDATWLGRILELHVATKQTVGAKDARRFVTLAETLGAPERGVREYLAVAEDLGHRGPIVRYCEKL